MTRLTGLITSVRLSRLRVLACKLRCKLKCGSENSLAASTPTTSTTRWIGLRGTANAVMIVHHSLSQIVVENPAAYKYSMSSTTFAEEVPGTQRRTQGSPESDGDNVVPIR